MNGNSIPIVPVSSIALWHIYWHYYVMLSCAERKTHAHHRKSTGIFWEHPYRYMISTTHRPHQRIRETSVELYTQSSSSCGGTTTSSSVLGSSPVAPRCVSLGTVGVGVDVGFGVYDFGQTELLVVPVEVRVAFVALWRCYVCGRYKQDILACMQHQKMKA